MLDFSGVRPTILEKLRTKAFKWLPLSMREQCYFNSLNLDCRFPEELTLKVAEGIDEIEEAFEVTYDSYLEAQLTEENSTGLLFTKFHAFPSTKVIVAKWNNEVVGTLTLVCDNPIGLPCEELVDLDEYRGSKSNQLAELFSFAVRENFRDRVQWPLIKFAYEYARVYCHIDRLFCSLPTSHLVHERYESLLFFEPISTKSFKSFSYSQGRPVKVESVDLLNLHYKLVKKYWGQTPEKDLYTYFHKLKDSSFIFPQKISDERELPLMKPTDMVHFFKECSSIFDDLLEFEKFCLADMYRLPGYEAALPSFNRNLIDITDRRKTEEVLPFRLNRTPNDSRNYAMKFDREIRFLVNGKASLSDSQENVDVLDLSLHGMRAKTGQKLRVGITYQLRLELEDLIVDEIKVKAVWAKKEEQTYGFRIDSVSANWPKVIHHLIDKKIA